MTVPDPQRQAIIDLLAAAMLTEEVTPWRARRNAAALVDGPLAGVIELVAAAAEHDEVLWHEYHSTRLERALAALDPAWRGGT